MSLVGPRSGTVKAARRLNRRATRVEARRFLAEGPQAVREAVSTGHCLELFGTQSATREHEELVGQAERSGARVHLVGDETLDLLADTVNPQGLVAVCPFVDVGLDHVYAGSARLVVVLVEVRDPGNAGTVVRTADAAGADAVVFTDASVDVYNAKCVRSSAGSIFHLPVVRGIPFERVVDAARLADQQILAADAAGARTVTELTTAGELTRATTWLFGNEARGLAPEAVDRADQVVSVPIYGRAESLNLSVSAALCMYASASAQRVGCGLVRQEDEPSPR